MPRSRPPKPPKHTPPDGLGAETQQRVAHELLGPTDPNAPTRVMRPGSDEGTPRQVRGGSAPNATPDHDPAPAPVPVDPAEAAPPVDPGSMPPRISGLGSGLLARQPTLPPGEGVTVRKVCPHCGTEYETDARFCPKDGAALRPTGGSDPLIGHTLGDRYHILSLVGEGGMGRIYLAEHVRMNRQCAVKIMRASLVNDADAAARFAREASSAARIIHPNVAAVFDYGESDGRIYLVMEFVDGESLGAILQTERVLSTPRALELGRQVADALAAAHELGIVHRDLKPDNILIARTKSGKEVAKVVDFGIAKAIEEGPGQKLTETGLVIGTPEFMSPEQLMGDPVDARSDVYSLGCILYLMLVGVPAADAPTREGMLKRRLNESAPHPMSANAALPAEIDAIVVKALATAADDRYQSAAELRDALAAVAVPLADAVPTGVADPLARTQTMPSHERVAMRRNGWTMRRHGVGAGVLVLALIALFLMQGDSGEPNSAAAMVQADSVAGLPRATVQAVPGSLGADSPAVAAPAPTPRATQRTPAQLAADSARARDAQRERDASSALRSALQAPVRRLANAVSSRDITRIREAFPGLTRSQEQVWENNFRTFTRITATPAYEEPVVAPGGQSATLGFTLRVGSFDESGAETRSNLRYTGSFDRVGGRWVLRGFTQR